jgi:hypothetical protein
MYAGWRCRSHRRGPRGWAQTMSQGCGISVDNDLRPPTAANILGTSHKKKRGREMLQFRLDVYAWIPQPDVPNPLAALPGGVTTWGRAACGSRFGGDDFTTPPLKPTLWGDLTYRARQSFAFRVENFGGEPTTFLDTGVVPGLTTVLTSPRAQGGTRCFALTPTVTKSASSVEFQSSDSWYEVLLHGAAHDPVPASAAGHKLGSVGSKLGHLMTPDLEWEVKLRIQQGTTLPRLTRLRYAASTAASLDSGDFSLDGNGNNLLHGLITVRRFPSYIVYATINENVVPVYFADASQRVFGLGQIVIGQTDPLRRVRW